MTSIKHPCTAESKWRNSPHYLVTHGDPDYLMTKWSWFPCRHNHWLMRWQHHSSLASYPVSCGEPCPSSALLWSHLPHLITIIILPFPDVNIAFLQLPPTIQSSHNTHHNHKTFDNTNINFNISNTNFDWVLGKLIIHPNDQLIAYAKQKLNSLTEILSSFVSFWQKVFRQCFKMKM